MPKLNIDKPLSQSSAGNPETAAWGSSGNSLRVLLLKLINRFVNLSLPLEGSRKAWTQLLPTRVNSMARWVRQLSKSRRAVSTYSTLKCSAEAEMELDLLQDSG